MWAWTTCTYLAHNVLIVRHVICSVLIGVQGRKLLPGLWGGLNTGMASACALMNSRRLRSAHLAGLSLILLLLFV